MTIPIISLPIPDGVIYLFLFFGGIYVWINFGLTLNSVLDSRLSAHFLLENLQSNSFEDTIDYRHTLEHVLSDSSIIDNFCIHYFDIYERNNFSKGGFKKLLVDTLTYFGLYCIYGILIGLFLTTQIIANSEYIIQKKISKPVANSMTAFLIVMLAASSLTFGAKMPFVMIWIGAIWGWTSLGIILWKWKRFKIIVPMSYEKS